MSREADQKLEAPTEIYVYLVVGAVLGLSLLLHPLILVTWWWTPLMDALREGQRSGVWKPAVVLLSILAGLAVMFGFLQPARKYERTDQVLRRIVYGYNSALTGILVLLMLIIGNVAIHVWAPRYLDATEGGFHSISDVTRTFVTDLERPTQVFVILPEADETQRNMLTLLSQLRELNPRNFSFEDVSPTINPSRFRALNKQFPQFNGAGLIVAMGEQPEKNYSFIPATELENQDFDQTTRQAKSREFAGEVRLMQELNHLSVNKKKPVVYFTQGHGEPDLAGAREDGMGALQFKLMREGYDIRPLKFVAGTDTKDQKVPDDADTVVVVGPQKSMADAIPALESYLLSPRGRMVVFLGPTPPDRAKKNAMTETGLEPMLQQFNVDVTGEQIFTFAIPAGERYRLDQSPDRVILGPYAAALDARHPLAVTFKDQALQWFDCRQVRTNTRNPALDAQPLMGSVGLVWTEADMSKQPADQHMLMQRDSAEQKRRCTPDTQTVVVAVSEKPTEPSKPGQARKPKLLVYGSHVFLTNQIQARGAGSVDADLVRSSIDWCRERYTSIGVQPKTYNSFIPGKISVPKLVVIPAALMLISILGFGLVVWNARRR